VRNSTLPGKIVFEGLSLYRHCYENLAQTVLVLMS